MDALQEMSPRTEDIAILVGMTKWEKRVLEDRPMVESDLAMLAAQLTAHGFKVVQCTLPVTSFYQRLQECLVSKLYPLNARPAYELAIQAECNELKTRLQQTGALVHPPATEDGFEKILEEARTPARRLFVYVSSHGYGTIQDEAVLYLQTDAEPIRLRKIIDDLHRHEAMNQPPLHENALVTIGACHAGAGIDALRGDWTAWLHDLQRRDHYTRGWKFEVLTAANRIETALGDEDGLFFTKHLLDHLRGLHDSSAAGTFNIADSLPLLRKLTLASTPNYGDSKWTGEGQKELPSMQFTFPWKEIEIAELKSALRPSRSGPEDLSQQQERIVSGLRQIQRIVRSPYWRPSDELLETFSDLAGQVIVAKRDAWPGARPIACSILDVIEARFSVTIAGSRQAVRDWRAAAERLSSALRRDESSVRAGKLRIMRDVVSLAMYAEWARLPVEGSEPACVSFGNAIEFSAWLGGRLLGPKEWRDCAWDLGEGTNRGSNAGLRLAALPGMPEESRREAAPDRHLFEWADDESSRRRPWCDAREAEARVCGVHAGDGSAKTFALRTAYITANALIGFRVAWHD